MTIYGDIISSTTDQNLIIVDNVLERMSASVGGHVMNLANLDKRIFLKGRSPCNFRIHIVYVAPSGWTKSTYFRMLLRQKYGLLWNQVFPIDVHSSFSVASWLGTITKDKESGKPTVNDGIFEKYKRGIIGADDYQALKILFDGEGIAEDERALMTALDTDEAVKNLALGQIRIPNVGITCWFGMRPTVMKLTSGLARRFTFARYFPTRKEAKLFRELSRKQLTPSLELEEPNGVEELPMFHAMSDAYNLVCDAGAVDIELDSVNGFLDRFDMPHFEENLYRNLAIGWSVANGSYPDIQLGEAGEKMLEDEILSREILRTDPFRMMFYRILDNEPDKTIKASSLRYFMKTYLQFTENETENIIRNEKLSKRIDADKDRAGNLTYTLQWKPDYLSQLMGGG